ncbi:MAG: hypothetical protein K0S14_2815, partial [Thermomicrobiales bacterium]|nr:hypothetical protein [Thermomicrobiales bacterium]
MDMGEDVGDRIEKLAAGKNDNHSPQDTGSRGDESESDAEAVASERTGRTNTARDMTTDPEQ